MFNVISDKWIKTDKGKYGIRELLEKAPELQEIHGENPLNEFSIYRLLFTFLMDALRPETADDCFELYECGSFDMKKIDEYIALCIEEGVTFDIFDKKRPFLQEPPDAFCKSDICSIAKLNKMIPVGTNKIFFDKRYEGQVEMTDEEIAGFLPTLTLYVYDGNGYKNPISGSPVYNILKGRNLFQTLVLGLIPISESGRPYGKPYWRYSDVKNVATSKDAPLTSPDLLFGLTLPIRRVCVIDNKTMYYRGKFYYEDPVWKDPYVAYIKEKPKSPEEPPKERPMNPKETLFVRWTDMLTIVDPKEGAHKAVAIYASHLKTEGQPVNLLSYEALTSKSKYKDMRKGSFELPPEYIDNSDMLTRAKILAADIETGTRFLAGAVYSTFVGSDFSHDSSIVAYVKQTYHEKADEMFKIMLNEKTLDKKAWLESLKMLAVDVLEAMMERKMSTPAMAKAMKQRAFMIGRFNKEIKKTAEGGKS